MIKLEIFNGYEWVFDCYISWDKYVKLSEKDTVTGNAEGKTWRAVL